MSGYVVHALLGVKDGRTDEASREFGTLAEALVGIGEIAEAVPAFQAVTLVHVEDWPSVVAGAEPVPRAGAGAAPGEPEGTP